MIHIKTHFAKTIAIRAQIRINTTLHRKFKKNYPLIITFNLNMNIIVFFFKSNFKIHSRKHSSNVRFVRLTPISRNTVHKSTSYRTDTTIHLLAMAQIQVMPIYNMHKAQQKINILCFSMLAHSMSIVRYANTLCTHCMHVTVNI